VDDVRVIRVCVLVEDTEEIIGGCDSAPVLSKVILNKRLKGFVANVQAQVL
jgi:hypothetical protein